MLNPPLRVSDDGTVRFSMQVTLAELGAIPLLLRIVENGWDLSGRGGSSPEATVILCLVALLNLSLNANNQASPYTTKKCFYSNNINNCI